MTFLDLILTTLLVSTPAGWLFWLTRNDYADGYRSGYFDATHGIPNDYAKELK